MRLADAARSRARLVVLPQPCSGRNQRRRSRSQGCVAARRRRCVTSPRTVAGAGQGPQRLGGAAAREADRRARRRRLRDDRCRRRERRGRTGSTDWNGVARDRAAAPCRAKVGSFYAAKIDGPPASVSYGFELDGCPAPANPDEAGGIVLVSEQAPTGCRFEVPQPIAARLGETDGRSSGNGRRRRRRCRRRSLDVPPHESCIAPACETLWAFAAGQGRQPTGRVDRRDQLAADRRRARSMRVAGRAVQRVLRRRRRADRARSPRAKTIRSPLIGGARRRRWRESRARRRRTASMRRTISRRAAPRSATASRGCLHRLSSVGGSRSSRPDLRSRIETSRVAATASSRRTPAARQPPCGHPFSVASPRRRGADRTAASVPTRCRRTQTGS